MLEEERFHNQLGRIIRTRREQLGLTQDQIAEALSLSRTSIVNIEKGRQRVIAYQLVRLATALRCEVVDLLPPTVAPREDELRQLLLGQRPSVVDWVTSQVSGAREEPK
jgi:transcriptional regulator with XRE-family HTH domain